MTDPVAPDSRQPGCQLDMFRDLPEGRLFPLLAALEHEAMKAAARGRARDAIRELSELRNELDGAASPAVDASAQLTHPQQVRNGESAPGTRARNAAIA